MRRAIAIVLSCLAAVAWAGSARRLAMISAQVPRNGLVSWWRPAVRGTTNDFWGDNDGALNGDAVATRNVGFELDGTGDYVRVESDETLDITNSITIVAWVYLTATEVEQKIVHKQAPGYKLGVYAGNGKIEFELRDPDNNVHINRNVAGGTILTTGRWYMVGGWWDGNEIRSIVDGTFERPYSYSGDLGTTTNDFGIGVKQFWDGAYLHGRVDEILLYNRALTSNEVYAVYNYGRRSHTP